MENEAERMQILELIDSGKITAEEGLSLLQALASSGEPGLLEETVEPMTETAIEHDPEPEAAEEPVQSTTAEEPINVVGEEVQIPQDETPRGGLPPDAQKWRRWWMIPLWVGVAITVAGGMLMYQALQAHGLGFWFVCASAPFIIGLAILVLAWQSRTAPWLHLRVQQKPGESPQRIALSFPLPIGPAAWFLHTFGHRIPKLKESSADELILALGDKTNPENPLYIQVDEGEDGEKVEIYIG